jgi:hypothetical protein
MHYFLMDQIYIFFFGYHNIGTKKMGSPFSIEFSSYVWDSNRDQILYFLNHIIDDIKLTYLKSHKPIIVTQK